MNKKDINPVKLINYYKLINHNLIYNNKAINRYKKDNFELSGDKAENLDKLKKSILRLNNSDLKRQAKNIVFSDGNPTGCSREGHCSRDVEGVGSITACSTGIDHGEIRPGTGERTGLSQDRGHGGQFIRHHALGAKCSKKGACLHRGQGFRQPGLHQGCCLIRRKILALDDGLQQGGPRDS